MPKVYIEENTFLTNKKGPNRDMAQLSSPNTIKEEYLPKYD